MKSKVFEGYAYKEAVVLLLIAGFITMDQAIAMRIEFKTSILKTISKN